jgi:signal transduction histidine kinase
MDRDGLLLEVADNGPGFDLSSMATSRGLGLAGMRERAQLLGGSFQVESRPGSGTRVRVRWPLLSAAQA